MNNWDNALAELVSADQRYKDLGGQGQPPEDWSQALDLMLEAYEALAADRCPAQATVAFSDAYAGVLAHVLRHDHPEA